MAAPESESDVLTLNPYESHPDLTPLQAEVLWEHAKLAHHLKQLTAQTRRLSEAPDEALLVKLRVLEKKMGLVLTLFKASVWAVINEQPPTMDAPSVDIEGEPTMDHTITH